MPTTMALRFRDLVGATIPEHLEIIGREGYVWWGWWNKPNELVPRTVFAAFRTVINREDHLDIFLVDSGNEVLYRAELKAIEESSTEDRRPSPEPERTPRYYRDAEYKAWFRLSAIDEIDASHIRGWSYDEVEEFLHDPTAERFQDKRVFGLREMLDRRHRTIYFLKPYETHHGDHWVELAPPTLPASFVIEPYAANSSKVLHVSDLHFGPEHGFHSSTDGVHKNLATLIREDLEREEIVPAVLVVSGDLTWHGKSPEFEQAIGFIQEMKSFFALTDEQIVVIPGNHDIQWSNPDEEPNLDAEVSRPAASAEENYRAFYKELFGINPGEYLAMGRRYILSNYVSLDIVALNSSRIEQMRFAGHGYVSIEQFESAANAIKWNSAERTTYRTIVLHHHLAPVTPKEIIDRYSTPYSITLDAGQITYKAIQYGVDLAMHGHMHQPFVTSICRASQEAGFPQGRSLAVHATGSAGVKREHTGAIGRNAYSLYSFSNDGVKIDMRAISENFDGFQNYWSCVLRKAVNGGLQIAQQGNV